MRIEAGTDDTRRPAPDVDTCVDTDADTVVDTFVGTSRRRGDERRRRATATTTVRIPVRIEAGTDDTTARRPALAVRAGGWDRGGDG